MATKLAKLVPLLDRVLVEKVAAKTKTVGGVLLPESATSKARSSSAAGSARRCAVLLVRHRGPLTAPCSAQVNEGKVISVGPGRRDKDGALLPFGAPAGAGGRWAAASLFAPLTRRPCLQASSRVTA